MFTSFGYFDDKEDDLTVLRNAYQSLKPGGIILIELLGKEPLARRYLATISTELGDGQLLIQRHEICEDWTRCRNEWILVKDRAAKTFKFQTRLYSGQEMKDILQRAGFEEVKVFGDLDGNVYGIDAERLIAVGQKRI
jgi:hypothetical protein